VRFQSALGHQFSPPLWLQDPLWSKPSLIIMSLWTAGGSMVIWLAGLQSRSTWIEMSLKDENQHYKESSLNKLLLTRVAQFEAQQISEVSIRR